MNSTPTQRLKVRKSENKEILQKLFRPCPTAIDSLIGPKKAHNDLSKAKNQNFRKQKYKMKGIRLYELALKI